MTRRHPRIALLTTTLGLIASVSTISVQAQSKGSGRPSAPAHPAQQQKAAPEEKATIIGAIQVRHYSSGSTEIGKMLDTKFVGPGVIIETIDSKRPTQFKVVADEVMGHRVLQGKKYVAVAELRGHIHYTVSKQTKEGKQVVQGLADRATYDQREERLHMIGGVDATVTDPKLEGPGTLRTDNLSLPTNNEGSTVVAGSPDVNDIRFTLRPQPTVKPSSVNKGKVEKATEQKGTGKKEDGKKETAGKKEIDGKIETAKKEEPKGLSGTLHLYHFRSAELNPGHTAHMTGANAVVDYSEPVEKTTGQIQANDIRTGLAAGQRQSDAKGDVHYHVERPDSKGNLQSITGTSTTLSYNPDKDRLEAIGKVLATFVDPADLKQPARISADHVTVHTAQQYRYEFEGSEERTSLAFSPRPKEKVAPPAAKAVEPQPVQAEDVPRSVSPFQGLALGDVDVTGFTHVIYEPGKNVIAVGDKTQYRSVDKETKTSMILHASRVTGDFASEGTLNNLDVTGNVRYEMDKPFPSGTGMQKITGAALSAKYSKKTNELVAQGPLEIRATKEGTTDPDIASGQKGDTATLNIKTNILSWVSPNNTFIINYEVPPPPAKPTLAPGKRRGKKNSNTRTNNGGKS